MRFELHKWYLDCTTPEGAALIVYAARLRWGWVRFRYGACLLALPDGPVRQAQSFNAGILDCADGVIRWRHPGFRIEGRWEGGTGHDPVCLYEGAPGRIDWHCLTANAQARVKLADGRELAGRGYAEELRLTLPPWRFPFDELRWGRFISDTGNAHRVWIDWRGGLARRWVWGEGGALATASIDDEAVRDDRGNLTLHEPRTLRDAPLGGSLLGHARGLGRLLPGGIARATEAKFLSRGLLTTAMDAAEGWAIHEVVRWR